MFQEKVDMQDWSMEECTGSKTHYSAVEDIQVESLDQGGRLKKPCTGKVPDQIKYANDFRDQ